MNAALTSGQCCASDISQAEFVFSQVELLQWVQPLLALLQTTLSQLKYHHCTEASHLLQCDYYDGGNLDKVDQLNDKKITILVIFLVIIES